MSIISNRDREQDRDSLPRIAHKLGLDATCRHVLICTGGKCAPKKSAKGIAKAIRKRLRLAKRPRGETVVTEVKCFKLCRGGPLLLVYPEGTWYRGVEEAELDGLVEQHLMSGEPEEEKVFLKKPLKP